MSLTIDPNINGYPGAIASKQADAPGRDPNTNRPAPGAGERQPAGRSQITDQIDIVSITININETTTTPNNQRQTELSSAITPLRNGGSAPQPIGEGYFSSPTNFVPTGQRRQLVLGQFRSQHYAANPERDGDHIFQSERPTFLGQGRCGRNSDQRLGAG